MKRIIILIFLLLAGSMIFSQTYITSAIRNDTTLTAAGNPYYISGYIDVPDSVTLTLDAGVNIRLGAPGFLYIHGKVVAKGKPGNMVLFEDSVTNPTNPWAFIGILGEAHLEHTKFINWDGVFIGGNGPAFMGHCEFDGCFRGISSYRDSVYIDSCDFRNCQEAAVLRNNPQVNDCYFYQNLGVGLAIFGGVVSRCTFVENRWGAGIYDPDAHSQILHSTFKNNEVGAYLESDTTFGIDDTFTLRHNVFILDSTVQQNGQTSVMIVDVDVHQLEFKENILCSDFNFFQIYDKPLLDLSNNCYCGLDSVQIAAKVQWVNMSAPFNPYIFAPFYSNCVPDDVYPGDTDHDRIADMRDLLPIGIHFGQTGTVRPGATINWIGQQAPDWNTTQANGRDIKHIDSNGDGTINADDTLAIVQNYGLTHRSYKSSHGGPPLILQARNGMASPSAGDTVILDLLWGNMDTSIQNVYGLAAMISYDTSQIDDVRIEFADSWLGTPGANMITLGYHDPATGRIDLGMVRTDGMNASGFGRVASIIVVIDDDISKRQVPLHISFEDAYAVNVAGGEEPVGPRVELPFIDVSTGLNDDLTSSITIFPNPVSDGQLRVRLPEGHVGGDVRLVDISGRAIATQEVEPALGEISLALGRQPAGLYLLQLRLGERRAAVKVVIR